MKILEVGCGNCKQSEAFVAIDIAKGACDIVADAHYLPFESSIFDAIIMYEVLDGLESPKRALKEIHRVLKSSGILRLSIPNVYYYRNIIRWIVKGRTAGDRSHKAGWRWSDIETLLTVCDFDMVEYRMIDEERHNRPSPLAAILPRITKHSFFIVAERVDNGKQ